MAAIKPFFFSYDTPKSEISHNPQRFTGELFRIKIGEMHSWIHGIERRLNISRKRKVTRKRTCLCWIVWNTILPCRTTFDMWPKLHTYFICYQNRPDEDAARREFVNSYFDTNWEIQLSLWLNFNIALKITYHEEEFLLSRKNGTNLKLVFNIHVTKCCVPKVTSLSIS